MHKKIVLIGPVYPYKGGSSHYTGLMYRELVKRYDVEMITYKMQYPKVLFHKEQRDDSNDSFKSEEAEYMLHTANPFNIFRTARHIRRPLILQEDRKARLLVVGEFGSDKEDYLTLIDESGIGERVNVVDSYTPDREVEQYFAAVDLVMLPYISATQSGIVQIAYGFAKPVLVTDVGGLPDVVENGQTGYVVDGFFG